MSEYFEATLQLRSMRKEIMDFVDSELDSNNVKVAKTKKQKNGIDLFLPSKRFANTLARKLIARFGGKINISTKLFGVSRTGKTINRVSVLYTASDFLPGDIVEVEGRVVKIREMGKFISGIDLASRKNVKILAKGRKIKKLEKMRASVCKSCPTFEVIHPETYQPVPVENPKETKKTTVNIVISGGKIYIYS